MKPAFSPLIPLLAAIGLAWAIPAEAASHREAPLIALDPSADRRVTFILNVNPGQDPSDGPNYFNFNDDVL